MIGGHYIENKSYQEAVESYIKCIELKEKEEAYRKLDEIYFINNTITVNNEKIEEKLLVFNNGECVRMIQERLIKFIDSYGSVEYFNKYPSKKPGWGYLEYLQDLSEIVDIASLIERSTITNKINEFLNNLSNLGKILARDAN